jgi:L-alanine-DL-glutamate epimerase-like enolase superfamily enzyme
MKLKVGAVDSEQESAGQYSKGGCRRDVKVMLDANQQWTLPQA